MNQALDEVQPDLLALVVWSPKRGSENFRQSRADCFPKTGEKGLSIVQTYSPKLATKQSPVVSTEPYYSMKYSRTCTPSLRSAKTSSIGANRILLL